VRGANSLLRACRGRDPVCFFANLSRAQDVPRAPGESPTRSPWQKWLFTANLRSAIFRMSPRRSLRCGRDVTRDNISGLDGVAQRTQGWCLRLLPKDA